MDPLGRTVKKGTAMGDDACRAGGGAHSVEYYGDGNCTACGKAGPDLIAERMLDARIKFVMVLGGHPAPWWWLSFADPARPRGTQFLGAAIVRGLCLGSALDMARYLRINPGGEVEGHEIPASIEMPARFTDRLLTREECEALDRELAARRS